MSSKTKIIGVLILIGLAFGVGYYATPSKVEIQIKEVVKTVTVKQKGKTKIVYRTRVTSPDGTITETENERTDTTISENTNTETKKEQSTVTTKDVGLTLSMLAISDIKNLDKREYGLHATKRVFSNVVVGAMVTTDKKIGVSVGLSF